MKNIFPRSALARLVLLPFLLAFSLLPSFITASHFSPNALLPARGIYLYNGVRVITKKVPGQIVLFSETDTRVVGTIAPCIA